jgi:signal transduction histidine kinase
VEDSDDDAELLLRTLRRGDFEPTCFRVETRAAALSALEQPWDAIIADYVVPGFGGLEALALVKQTGLDVPFILISGKMGEETLVEAMKAGAHDCITKDNLTRLAPAIRRELAEAEMRRDRNRIERQLQRAQRLELAGRLAGQVAHDLKNMIQPLLSGSEMISMLLPEGHPANKCCDAMARAARRMDVITNDLFALGRRGLVDQQPLDVNAVVEESLGQLGQTPRSLQVEVSLASNLPVLQGSPSQLLRVISNLLGNAREAMQDVGRLTVRTGTRAATGPFGYCTRIEAGEYVRLEVTDTGPGIAPEVLDKIFEPFFTTKNVHGKHGTGLGLTVVQAIIADHRGSIDVETEPGSGTTFAVYLPCGQARG